MIATFPASKSEIVNRIYEAGVVGAGGAGFPTHIKADSRAEIVIANACECEPLIRSDRFVLEAFHEEVLEGLHLMMLATGSSKGLVALREGSSIPDLEKRLASSPALDIVRVPNTYPAGDEHILVYEATGRIIPQAGIPLDVGVVVSNVNTLLNVSRAVHGRPVTSRIVSVCGDIPKPCVTEVPIGTSVGFVLEATGNQVDLKEKAILLSGVMMGEICEDLTRTVDKRIGAIIVLPRSNRVVISKSLSVETMVRRAASVCCQCQLCTEICPRHLMGHAISPHKIMRAVAWMITSSEDLAGALLCSGCGLCGSYVCPMALSPDRISYMVRRMLAERGIRAEAVPSEVRPLRAWRLVPHERILNRTGVGIYERDLNFVPISPPGLVRIPLLQHSGVPASPKVAIGRHVSKGDLIGEPQGLGARVHASIDGIVKAIDDFVTIESK